MHFEGIGKSKASRLTLPRFVSFTLISQFHFVYSFYFSSVASPQSTHSKDSNNELLSGFPLVDAAPQASSSAKASVGRKDPKSKTTVKVVEDSKASNPTPSGMAYKRVRLPPRSRKNTSIVSKGKAQQVVVSDKDSTSNEVESEDEDEDEEVAPPPKRLKTTSPISGKTLFFIFCLVLLIQFDCSFTASSFS